jgi:5-methylthioribose kinase
VTLREDAMRAHPGFPWLALDDPAGIQDFLAARGWLRDGERVVGCERAGEGNMNLTVRVHTDDRSVILKQARPWVEKYDDIPAPWERSAFERRFYERVAGIAGVAERMPELIASDPEARALLLEDLPGTRDCTDCYAGGPLGDDEIAALAGWIAALHAATRGEPEPALSNREMRALNHAHIFEVPFTRKNGLELDAIEPGLAQAAAALRDCTDYRARVAATGERYLADGPCLVHGDYFPGSWLRSDAGLRVIDPEFGFYGEPEFDLGCALAHFALAAQPLERARYLVAAYVEMGGREPDRELLGAFAGCEVMRRLIGVAQLPLPAHTPRAALLARTRETVLDGSVEALFGSGGTA